MKTIKQALIDEIFYPIPEGKVDNVLIIRGLDGEDEFSADVYQSDSYKGALADCLFSLIQAVNFSEADKSISAPSEADKRRILRWMNSLYKEIDEPIKNDGTQPRVIAKDFLL